MKQNQKSNTPKVGLVIRKNRGQALVSYDEDLIPCAYSSMLRKTLIYPTADASSLRKRVERVESVNEIDPVAIGDWVEWLDAKDGTGLINKVLPRRNELKRKAAGPVKSDRQVIAANIDQLIAIIAAAKPAPKWQMLDRVLVTAESAGIPAVICITKTDLVNTSTFADSMSIYKESGYQIIYTSSASGSGIGKLHTVISKKVSLMVGKSGVGKTSLLNALYPGYNAKVGVVGDGQIGKGKHTTTHLEMAVLPDGGGLIDTPGMREFGINQDMDTDIAWCFPEIRHLLWECKFGVDCTHTKEPGCLVREAVNTGLFSEQRYQSFLKLSKEI